MRTLTYFPQSLIKEELDRFLAKGFFRGRDMMYHCPVAITDDGVYTVIRTRLPLEHHTFRKGQRKLINKCSKAFRYEFGKASISIEKEELFETYKKTFKGNLPGKLANNLKGSFKHPYFDTYEVRIYDKEKLIAASFFDIGDESMASIMGIYHPDYAAYSLGIFTMYIEVIYAQELGLKYYYAGYILPGNNRFQYKERVGELECIDQLSQWSPLKDLDRNNLLVDGIKHKLEEIETTLKAANIPFTRYQYPLFDMAYYDTGPVQLFKNVLFLLIDEPNEYDEFLLLEYHHKAKTFILSNAYFYKEKTKELTGDLTEMYKNPINWLYLIEMVEVISTNDNPQRMVNTLAAILAFSNE